MFDLFRSRDKLVRIMLGAILLVVAASMVTYLIPNSGLNTTTGTDETVLAEVAGQKLS
jgi:peptidyl-prolyl cis-trans isomerase D